MKEKEYIITWLKQMAVKFPWITFKYEFLQKKHAHCVEVYPKNLVETSDEYCEEENAFSAAFETSFGDSVLFSTEDELFKCSENAEMVKGKVKSSSDCIPVEGKKNWCDFISSDASKYDKTVAYAGENNYALAA